MAIFPHLEIESDVQIDDRTRLSASKSYVTQDNDPIETISIQPGSTESLIQIYDSSVDLPGANAIEESWYLDWEFSQSADISALNNKIDFTENGTVLAATLTTANYATISDLLTEVQTQLNAVGSETYSVSIASGKVTISSTGNFELLPSGVNKLTSILPVLGFLKKTQQGSSATGEYIEYLPVAVTLSIFDGTSTVTETRLINVFSVDGDYLYSTDTDLRRHEADILRFVEKGRNSFLNIHRRAQHMILAWLDRNGYVNLNNQKFKKRDLIDIEEVHEWSVFLTLRLIFEGVSNAVDDVFAQKAKYYESLENYWRDRAVLRIDVDGDGELTQIDELDIKSAVVVRR